MQRWYRLAGEGHENCFYVEVAAPLDPQELAILQWLLAETFEPEKLAAASHLGPGNGATIEVGPRLNFETAFSTNAVAICHACGLRKVSRVEKSRRWLLPKGQDPSGFLAARHDRMTECPYPVPLESFATGLVPEKVVIVPLLEKGIEALRALNLELGLGMDSWDLTFYHDLFARSFRRNPTNVECFQLAQANSEHSRHWFFKSKLVIDGAAAPETLMEIIKSTLHAHPANSVIAFKDNSSAIRGYEITTILPDTPGKRSAFKPWQGLYDLIFTAETHNFPSGVAPFPGAETGTGGRIRDVHATGRGSLFIAGTAGYCVGNLNLKDFPIPGEDRAFAYPGNLASPIQILIGESNGASDYGNKFGEPLIQGFTRTFGLPVAGRQPQGVGQADHVHGRSRTARCPPPAKGRPSEGHAGDPDRRPGVSDRHRRRRGIEHDPGREQGGAGLQRRAAR